MSLEVTGSNLPPEAMADEKDGRQKKEKPIHHYGVKKNPDGTFDYSRALTYQQESPEIRDPNRLKIPPDISIGSANMVYYRLRNSIMLNKERKSDRYWQGQEDNIAQKNIGNFIRQQEILKSEIVRNLIKDKIFAEAKNKGEILSNNEFQDKVINFPASDAADIIDNNYIPELEKELVNMNKENQDKTKKDISAAGELSAALREESLRSKE